MSQGLRSPNKCSGSRHRGDDQAGDLRVEVRSIVWKELPACVRCGVKHSDAKDTLSRVVVEPGVQDSSGDREEAPPCDPLWRAAGLQEWNDVPRRTKCPEEDAGLKRAPAGL